MKGDYPIPPTFALLSSPNPSYRIIYSFYTPWLNIFFFSKSEILFMCSFGNKV